MDYAKINEHLDDVVCVPECGNTVLGEGFYPASPEGLISPAVGSGWDSFTIACLDCGRLINTDPAVQEPADDGDDWHPFRAPVTGQLATVPTLPPD